MAREIFVNFSKYLRELSVKFGVFSKILWNHAFSCELDVSLLTGHRILNEVCSQCSNSYSDTDIISRCWTCAIGIEILMTCVIKLTVNWLHQTFNW